MTRSLCDNAVLKRCRFWLMIFCHDCISCPQSRGKKLPISAHPHTAKLLGNTGNKYLEQTTLQCKQLFNVTSLQLLLEASLSPAIVSYSTHPRNDAYNQPGFRQQHRRERKIRKIMPHNYKVVSLKIKKSKTLS